MSGDTPAVDPGTPLFPAIDRGSKELCFFRNVLCAYYDACLSRAAYADALLDCSACSLKNTVREFFVLSVDDICGCGRLLGAVFRCR